MFSISSSDTFTQVTGSPFPTGAAPGPIAFSPGSDLLANGNGDSTVSVFSVASSGALTTVPGSPYATGATVSPAVTFGRAGGLLAAAAQTEPNSTVSLLSVGAPTATITSPLGGGAYKQGQVVTTAFGCTDAPYAPGIASCTDSSGRSSGSGQLDTSSVGNHTYMATATSLDGQKTSASTSYTVVSLKPKLTLTMTIKPKRAGRLGQPGIRANAVPVTVDFKWTIAPGAHVTTYTFALPTDISLKTCVKQVASSGTATCKYKMVMKQSPSGALRLGIERKSQACGPKLDVVTVKTHKTRGGKHPDYQLKFSLPATGPVTFGSLDFLRVSSLSSGTQALFSSVGCPGTGRRHHRFVRRGYWVGHLRIGPDPSLSAAATAPCKLAESPSVGTFETNHSSHRR